MSSARKVGYYVGFLLTPIGMTVFMLGGLGMMFLASTASPFIVPYIAAWIALFILTGHVWGAHLREEPVFMGLFNILRRGDTDEEDEKEDKARALIETCYTCNTRVDGSNKYSEFTVKRKGDAKRIGLCEECTRTYCTLLDYHDVLVDKLDRRENPIDL